MSPTCAHARALAERLFETPLSELSELLSPVVRHVLQEDCRQCRRLLSQLSDTPSHPLADSPSPIVEATKPEDAEAASRLAAKLVEMPVGRRRLYLSSSTSPAARPLVEALIRESRRYLWTDSAKAVEIAELAVFCADNAPARETDCEEAGDFDLVAEALAELSSAHRRDLNFRAAASALEEAEAAASLGTGEATPLVIVLRARARLERDLGRLGAALAVLDEAVDRSAAEHMEHEQSKIFYERSIVLGRLGRFSKAIADLHTALLQADLEREPRLGLAIVVALAQRAEAAGRYEEALSYLAQAERDWSGIMNPGDRARVTWTRGCILAATHRLDDALVEFACARDAFIDHGSYLSAATVSLELAEVLARLGRFREVRRLASEMLVVFRAVEVPREATAALYLLAEARSMEAVEKASAAINQTRRSGRSSRRRQTSDLS